MKINVHAHVFNFQSILTKETILLLSHRLSGKNLPEPLRDAILSYLRTRRKSRSKDISLDDFHRTIRKTRFFNRLMPGKMRDFFDRHLELPPSSETASLLTSLLEASVIDRNQASSSTVINTFEWLRIGFAAAISDVADDLIVQMDEDDLAVLLPMDIIDPKAGSREKKLFPKQLADTTRQALRFPGRLLPFGMVNPARKESFELFREAINSGWCVGLKLYPALGYSIRGEMMDEVLAFCDSESVPVLLHCNDTGFRKSPDAAQYGHPGHWIPVLEKHSSLKVCFGHFGGEKQDDEDVWIAPGLPRDSWAHHILDLMDRFPGRVFADVSYHNEQYDDPDAGDNYRKNLAAVLENPKYRSQVLWGTDYHLLRIDCTDPDYTDAFCSMIGEDNFELMARKNPAAFLGLPVDDAEEKPNIARHVRWLLENNARAVHGKPAPWLRNHPEGNVIEGSGTDPAGDAPWDVNNRIHTSLFNFIWNYKEPDFLSEGMRKRINRESDDIKAKFEHLGRTPIGELTFHSGALSDSTDRNQSIRSFCNRLDTWFGRVNEIGRIRDINSAFYRKMNTVCSDPGKTIPKIAPVLEQFYRVSSDLTDES